MMNCVDLLTTFKSTVRRNDNISYLFMIYQFLLFATSILGPGTVLMMIAGSFNAVLGTNLWQSHIIALSPTIFYTAVCFTTKGDTQVLLYLLKRQYTCGAIYQPGTLTTLPISSDLLRHFCINKNLLNCFEC